jgi:hypothetical protein
MIRIIKDETYKVSENIGELSEGVAVIYLRNIVSFISFVDNEQRNGIINYNGEQFLVDFDKLELIIESTNPNDGTPML